MSIIRDLLEYYRLPAEVRLHQEDFEVENDILNGYEDRYYYDKDKDYDGSSLPGQPYRMVIDQYTTDNVRYRRTYFFYNDRFNVTSISSQYEYGKKQKDESYTYGDDSELISINTVETDIDVTWVDMEPSTGWPGYFNSGGLQWIRVDSFQNAEPFRGYLCDTTGGSFSIVLPSDPEVGVAIGFEDVESNFGTNAVTIGRNGATIMGLDQDLTLNEDNQGLQLVYDGIGDWRIVWTTPLIANVTV